MMKCLGNLVVICPNSSFVYHLINKVGVFGVISEMMLKERDQDREKVRE